MFQGREQMLARAMNVRAPMTWKSVSKLWTMSNFQQSGAASNHHRISWDGKQVECVNEDHF